MLCFQWRWVRCWRKAATWTLSVHTADENLPSCISLMWEDRHFELIPPLELDISFGSTHSIFHHQVHYSKVCVGILGAKSHRWPQTCRMGASSMHLLVTPTKEISFCSNLLQGIKHVLISWHPKPEKHLWRGNTRHSSERRNLTQRRQ